MSIDDATPADWDALRSKHPRLIEKVRKGGKITMGHWCDKEGFKHYTLHTAQELVKYVEGK